PVLLSVTPATPELSTLSLHDALPICGPGPTIRWPAAAGGRAPASQRRGASGREVVDELPDVLRPGWIRHLDGERGTAATAHVEPSREQPAFELRPRDLGRGHLAAHLPARDPV